MPETALRTERLLLRPFEAADVEAVAEACGDPVTQRWLPLPTPYTREHARQWCTVASHESRTSGRGIELAITGWSPPGLLGCIGLKATSWRTLCTEVGYWMAPWARNHGFATEACRALTDWVFQATDMERVSLLAATGNVASQKVAQNAGYTREGVLRNAGLIHAGRTDLICFSKIRADR